MAEIKLTPSGEPKRKIKDVPVSLPTPLKVSDLIVLHARLGLSTKELAEKLKITPATVYQWYNKRGPIRLKDSTMDALNALINEKSETR
jgi:DNA-binding transcriptional regulator YiaG